MATMEMKLTSVKGCYEESPPCQRVEFLAGEITENHFHYETSDNQETEQVGRRERKEGRKKDT